MLGGVSRLSERGEVNSHQGGDELDGDHRVDPDREGGLSPGALDRVARRMRTLADVHPLLKALDVRRHGNVAK